MTKPLIFLGSSRQLTLPEEICLRREIPIAGIIDSDYYGNTSEIDGIPVIGSEKSANWDVLNREYDFFIGTNPIPTTPRDRQKRRTFINLGKEKKLNFINLIDPESRVGRKANLGRGIFIGYCAIVNSHVTVGDHCIIHALSGVAHHATLGENVVVQRMSLVTADAVVGDNAYIGIGARCIKMDGMRIGSNSYIHPCVTVLRDVEDDEIVSLTGKNTRRIYNAVVEEQDELL